MNIPKQILWLIAIFFIQQLPAVSAWGIDLPLIFVVLVGLRSTAPSAGAWGFFVGLAQDLLSAGWIGPHTVAKTLVGLLSCFSQRHIYRERVLTQTFLIFWMALFHQVFIWLLLRWDGSAPLSGDAFGVIIRGVSMTTLMGIVICFFVVKFRRRRFDPATA
jgi:rod shape-determining protein MreD